MRVGVAGLLLAAACIFTLAASLQRAASPQKWKWRAIAALAVASSGLMAIVLLAYA